MQLDDNFIEFAFNNKIWNLLERQPAHNSYHILRKKNLP